MFNLPGKICCLTGDWNWRVSGDSFAGTLQETSHLYGLLACSLRGVLVAYTGK